MAIGLIAAGLSIGSSIFSAISAKKQEQKAKDKEKKARREMERLKNQYENIDTSNPFLNMENTMEDLVVNQQQAQFEAQQNQQAQANILANFRDAAGSSGIAALAQTMAQQGQIAAQRSAASIGQQEAVNQRLAAQEAGNIQSAERRGELISRAQQRDQVGTFLGMAQQETAAYAQQAGLARQARMDAISGAVGSAASMFAGFGGGERPLLDSIGGGSNRLSGYDAGQSMTDYIQTGLRGGNINQVQNQYEDFDVFGGRKFDSSKYYKKPWE